MNKYIFILVFIVFCIGFTMIGCTFNKRYIKVYDENINSIKDTTELKNRYIWINHDNHIRIERKVNDSIHGRYISYSQTIDGEIGEYSVSKFRKGKRCRNIKVYNSNGKLLRVYKVRNGIVRSIW